MKEPVKDIYQEEEKKNQKWTARWNPGERQVNEQVYINKHWWEEEKQ